MTLEQTGTIMDILSAAYPRFYAGPDAPDPQNALKLWWEIFQDDDVAFVAAAVKSYICADEKGFPPHPGAIKNAMHRLEGRGGLDAAGAWALVRKAVRNSCYEAQKEFDALPESIQRIVGSPSQLRDWAGMETGILNSVVASNFQKAYQVRQESLRQEALLPNSIRQALSGLTKRMALGDGM